MGWVAHPDAPIAAIEDLSLAELLDLEVDVATRTDENLREAPGLVTVLTADDLRRAGCRDLEDALRLLPAIDVGTDTWGAVGLAVRGNWGFEGKVLVQIDGHDWNETDYGTFALGHRLPASAIERIEVVRGPGSAVYGGYASLAVVQVTTRATEPRDGTKLGAHASWLPSGIQGGDDLAWSGGYPLGDRGRLGVSAVVGSGRRTDGTYRDVLGETADLTDASAIDPALLSAELRLGSFTLAAMGERYHGTQRTNYGSASDVRNNDFDGAYVRAAWDAALSERWTLTPRASVQWQLPWHNTENVRWDYRSVNQTDREMVGVDLQGHPVDALDLLVGGEAGRDHSNVPPDEPQFWVSDRPNTQFGFGAAWAQGVLHGPPVNVTGGVRVDGNSAYGGALSPRVGLTRAWAHEHFKVQWSRAFHAPGFEQSQYGVRPERSTTLEAEGGVGPTSWMYLTGSVFQVRLTDELVYGVMNDPHTGVVTEGYTNLGESGTRGGELAVDLRARPLSLNAGWTAQSAAGLSRGPDAYRVPGQPAAHLGLANDKGVVRASVDGPHGLWFGTVVTVLGPRSAITAVNDRDQPVYTALPTAALLDLTLGVQHLAHNLDLGLDVHDLLNQAPALAQPYDGLHAPLPGTGRDVGLRVTAVW